MCDGFRSRHVTLSCPGDAGFVYESWPMCDKCSGTPSGGCVVGRCWEACSSWVPVPLFGALVWSLLMARSLDSKAYTLFPLH